VVLVVPVVRVVISLHYVLLLIVGWQVVSLVSLVSLVTVVSILFLSLNVTVSTYGQPDISVSIMPLSSQNRKILYSWIVFLILLVMPKLVGLVMLDLVILVG